MSITAINVFVEVDGKQCIALIDPTMADMFMGMLGAYQRGQPSAANLSVLPDYATEHLFATRQAILDYVETKRAQAQKGQA